MKQTLLSALALILCFLGKAQTAYQAPGVFVCSQTSADVQPMTPFILGAQNPSDFTVGYFMTQADAVANTNTIAGLIPYCCGGLTTVYARVTANSSGSFATTNFKVVWEPQNFASWNEFLSGCGSVFLPYAQIGAFYTEHNGMGFQFPPGSSITFNDFFGSEIYWYAGNETCFAEETFNIFLDYPPYLLDSGITQCAGDETFDLTQIPSTAMTVTYYNSQQDAWNMANPIQNPTAYEGTDGETIWAYLQGPICQDVQSFTLNLHPCTPYAIYGRIRASQNGTNCAASDPGFPGCRVSRTTGSQTYHAYTNTEGDYLFTNVPGGSNTVAPSPTQPYVSVLNPASSTVNVTNFATQADFCIVENPWADVRTVLHAMGDFRPNITTKVLLQVSNLGNVAASGTITLTYDSAKTNYVSSTLAPTSSVPGTLTFSYNALPALYGQNIYVDFYTPTTTVMGDQLAFSATAVLSGDQNLANNTATMNQVVVNSYDPNDISVAEGAIISPAQAQGYLHYMVRFQNTGTAEAFDVRIENPISELLDMDTFRPIMASHTYFTESVNNNVTFHFPNIDLPASGIDEPNSHGWVIYEVKPVAGIEIGDVIENQAFIYFDTNPAVDTNTVTTTVQQLSTHDSRMELFALYPNPADGKFTIRSVEASNLDLEITDARGTKVLSRNIPSNEATVDVSHLGTGLYFVKISSQNGSAVKKLMVR